MKKICLVITFILWTHSSWAYRAHGIENIQNLKSSIREAQKIGLGITKREQTLKKDLLTLKQKKPQEFQQKIEDKVDNSTERQGHLYEVRDGLAKTEQAKQIAKLVLFKKIQEDWDILKTTVLNSATVSSFKTFRPSLITQLNQAVYVPSKDGYSFEVKEWGIVIVYPSLKTVRWKVEFNSKYDGNDLEDGAENIQIESSSENSF